MNEGKATWYITKDIINEGETRNEVGYPFLCNPKDMKLPIRFRLKDGDDEIYFEGRTMEATFAPLDELGSSYGCVTLEYLEDGCWKEL